MEWCLQNDEFSYKSFPQLEILKIQPEKGEKERVVAFLKELAVHNVVSDLVVPYFTHGGFIPIECAPDFQKVHVWSPLLHHQNNLEANLKTHPVQLYRDLPSPNLSQVWYSENGEIMVGAGIIICYSNIQFTHCDYTRYIWEDTGFDVHVHSQLQTHFTATFLYEINDEILTYDNLLHFCMIVKNGGEQLENMLINNAPFFDRWTIIDTGSTDGTIERIERVLKNKRGCLYREDFKNFGATRNRCLDYAEKRDKVACKYVVMLDDTYILQGDIRAFFRKIRGDHWAHSFSLLISNGDSQYLSNRIIKTDSKLRYKYRIHEVLEDLGNINVLVPFENASLLDFKYDYMEERTKERHAQDIKWLEEEIQDNPVDPRNYYYMAQTYRMMGEYEKAYVFYAKRAEFVYSGFLQERVDAVFEMARLANFQINKPWLECQALYEKAYQIDPTRPESLYFIGLHYYQENKISVAYDYFKKAYELGYPIHCQHSLKPTLSYHFVPLFLTQCCFHKREFVLGIEVAKFFMTHNPSTTENFYLIKNWHDIFQEFCLVSQTQTITNQPKFTKPLCVLVVHGGFHEWTGSDILIRDMGGSESCMVKWAQHLQTLGYFQVVLFCNCKEDSVFEGVEYRSIRQLYPFVRSHNIHTCIVSRYTASIPVLSEMIRIENLYLILHDLLAPQTILVKSKLKGIFCLSEWHKQYVQKEFGQFENLLQSFSYGIDWSSFNGDQSRKVPYSFMYSSFPERGLLPLLQMWPKIVGNFPTATLNIFVNMDIEWSNQNYPEKMAEIRRLLSLNLPGVCNHGRVSKTVLANYWKSSEYWLYPCTFRETFCMTALEAAAAKVLVITNGLAALEETAHSERTMVIPGNPESEEWQNNALQIVLQIMKNKPLVQDKIMKNYEWAKGLTWESRVKVLNNILTQPRMERKGSIPWTEEESKEKVAYLTTLAKHLIVSKLTSLKILAVGGVWTGIQLITTLQHIRRIYLGIQIQAVAMDPWEDSFQSEESFDANVIAEGFQPCIEKRKGKVETLLRKAIQESQRYSLIMIGSSSVKYMDTLVKLLWAWELLQVGGVLIIEPFSEEETVSQKICIEAFLNQNKTEFQILYAGNRMFLKKTRHLF